MDRSKHLIDRGIFGSGKILYFFRIIKEFCYGVYNQCELFIWLDLMVKNREIPIER
jgi:hypothetical protein